MDPNVEAVTAFLAVQELAFGTYWDGDDVIQGKIQLGGIPSSIWVDSDLRVIKREISTQTLQRTLQEWFPRS